MMSIASGSKCSGCASESLEEDDGMVVCTTCGKVVEDAGGVRHDATQNTGMSDPSISFLRCRRLNSRMGHEVMKRMAAESGEMPTEAKKECLAMVRKLADRLCFTRDMKQELNKYVKDSLYAELHHTSRGKMISVAGICAYITMIKNGKPVTVSEICSITDCAKQDFASLYYKYLSQYPQNHPGLQKLDQLIPCSLKAVSFEESEKLKINKLVHDLLALFDQIMLIESKCPSLLILAASFIAWKSLERSRSATPFSKFRTITRLRSEKNHATVLRHVKELEDQMIRLAASIPWLSHIKITRSTTSHYVNEVLQFKKSVIYDHKSQVELNQIPPKPTAAPVVEETVDGDQEISDSEIDMYIRSPAEVSAVKRLRAAFGEE